MDTHSPHRLKQGRHPSNALTPHRVSAVMKPGRYADGNGLYLVVDHRGSKYWILRTVIAGKRCDIGLGSAALVLLAKARREAARLRDMARSGGDPLAQRRKERRVMPVFEQAAREVHTAHAAAWKNAKHGKQWISTLEEYVFPMMGSLRVDHVATSDVLKVLTPVWLKKPETARRIRQRIKLVLNWAKASGYRSGDNPVDGLGTVLPAQTDDPVHHAALPYAEVPAFISSLRRSDALPITRLAFEFLILTATRTNETLGALWDEIDGNGKVWTIAGSRMKAGREHRVPLSPRCIEILTEARNFWVRGPFVFGNSVTGDKLSNMALLMMLRRMNIKITAHGFRSSFRDWAAEKTNMPNAVCERALAHAIHDKTEKAYERTDLFDKRVRLMERWAAFATAVKADVVPITRRQA